MARRDRFRNLVWLKCLQTDMADGRVRASYSAPQPIKDSIRDLTAYFGLWIEMELVDGFYFLRCYPRSRVGAEARPGVCASYKGESLAAVLHVAVQDYTQYMASPAAAELSRYEACRWVA